MSACSMASGSTLHSTIVIFLRDQYYMKDVCSADSSACQCVYTAMLTHTLSASMFTVPTGHHGNSFLTAVSVCVCAGVLAAGVSILTFALYKPT